MSYLKIKDDIDLKELEKFGFQELTRKQTNVPQWYNSGAYGNAMTSHIEIITYNRKILVFTTYGNVVLFDLIQAGLVEKVEE